MATRTVTKDLKTLVKTIASFSDGQATVDIGDSTSEFDVTIMPNDGVYKGAHFKFNVVVGDSYPDCAPAVFATSAIVHPNVEYQGEDNHECNEICLSLMDEWSADFSFEDVVQGLLFLMYEPNFDDPLNGIDFCSLYSDALTRKESVRVSLFGVQATSDVYTPLPYNMHDVKTGERVDVSDIEEDDIILLAGVNDLDFSDSGLEDWEIAVINNMVDLVKTEMKMTEAVAAGSIAEEQTAAATTATATTEALPVSAPTISVETADADTTATAAAAAAFVPHPLVHSKSVELGAHVAPSRRQLSTPANVLNTARRRQELTTTALTPALTPVTLSSRMFHELDSFISAFSRSLFA